MAGISEHKTRKGKRTIPASQSTKTRSGAKRHRGVQPQKPATLPASLFGR